MKSTRLSAHRRTAARFVEYNPSVDRWVPWRLSPQRKERQLDRDGETQHQITVAVKQKNSK